MQAVIRSLGLNIDQMENIHSNMQAVIQELGLICHSPVQGEINLNHYYQILPALFKGVECLNKSNFVRLTSLQAINNTIASAPATVVTNYCNKIVNILHEATFSHDITIRQEALGCLGTIANKYYGSLGECNDALMKVTIKAMKKDVEPVAVKAIEFWQFISVSEFNIELGCGPPGVYSHHLVKGSHMALVDALLKTLKRQNVSLSISKAGAKCLSSVLQLGGNKILKIVTPFMIENTKRKELQLLDAGMNAFYSVLLAANTARSILKPDDVIEDAIRCLDFILSSLISSQNNVLKETFANCLAQIIKLSAPLWNMRKPIQIISSTNFPSIVHALCRCMEFVPSVAYVSFGAMATLAAGFNFIEKEDCRCPWTSTDTPSTSLFWQSVQALLTATLRQDIIGPMRRKAYKALQKLVLCSTYDDLFIFGDNGVGKTTLLSGFLSDSSATSSIATRFDFKIKTIDSIVFQIWGTADPCVYEAVRRERNHRAVVIVLVYDITDRASFTSVQNFIQSYPVQTSNNVILVGNKSDAEQKVVHFREGKELADEHNIRFFETSAIKGINVSEVFNQIQEVIKQGSSRRII